MKNYIFCILASLMLIFLQPAWADEKGTEIVQAVYDRPDGQTMVSKTVMTLESPGSHTRVREFYSYRKDFADGQIKSLIRFTVPADVKDTGLLTYNHVNGDSDQWLYLPALGTSRRISGDRKGGRFVGSDVSYEDLQDRKVSKDIHKFLGQKELNGALCNVVESIPVEASNSAYSKRIMWVHPETMIPIRVDFFQNKPEPIKRLLVRKIDKIQGFWTAMETEVTDLNNNHKTLIRTQSIQYNQDFSNDLFAQSILQNPAAEIAYRP